MTVGRVAGGKTKTIQENHRSPSGPIKVKAGARPADAFSLDPPFKHAGNWRQRSSPCHASRLSEIPMGASKNAGCSSPRVECGWPIDRSVHNQLVGRFHERISSDFPNLSLLYTFGQGSGGVQMWVAGGTGSRALPGVSFPNGPFVKITAQATFVVFRCRHHRIRSEGADPVWSRVSCAVIHRWVQCEVRWGWRSGSITHTVGLIESERLKSETEWTLGGCFSGRYRDEGGGHQGDDCKAFHCDMAPRRAA